MLTEEVLPTRGNISISGHSLQSDMDLVRRNTGYCPQFGGLPLSLTARETLSFYARLRNIPEAHVAAAVETALSRLSLSGHADLPCGLLSGEYLLSCSGYFCVELT